MQVFAWFIEAKRGGYTICGNFSGFQYYDFIYQRNVSQGKLSQYINFLFSELHVEEVKIIKLSPYSMLPDAFSNIEGFNVSKTSVAGVMINFENGYDELYNSLTKNQRQNIRTAYNRCRTDEHKMRLEISTSCRQNSTLVNKTIDLYCNRHQSRYGERQSIAKKLYLKTMDFSTNIIKSAPENYLSVLFIDDDIAAFMGGIVDVIGKSVIVPRLSIDKKYEKYSPGIILIEESIKELYKRGILHMDLSYGEEPYKFAVGGRSYEIKGATITNGI